MKIEIGDREYNVTCARTEEERIKGLQGVTEMKDDEGMLFFFEEPQTVGFWMKDTKIPLDIIFINEDMEVISVYQGEPENENIAEEDDVRFVLEVNQGSGIKEGDELDILVTLVEAYEAKHYPIPACDPVEAIKFRIEQLGLETNDLTPIIGSRSKVSEVLNHKRRLSITMIRNLHAHLNIPYELLIGA